MNTNNNDNSTNVQMGMGNVASKYQIKSKKSLKKKTRIELKREAREEARKKMRLEIAKRKRKQKKQMKNGKQETMNIVFVQDKYKNYFPVLLVLRLYHKMLLLLKMLL